jgi:hypothetical protein
MWVSRVRIAALAENTSSCPPTITARCGGYYIAHAKTTGILWFGRSLLKDGSDPRPSVDVIKSSTKVYPYVPGGVGTTLHDRRSG